MELLNVPGVRPGMRSRAGSGCVARNSRETVWATALSVCENLFPPQSLRSAFPEGFTSARINRSDSGARTRRRHNFSMRVEYVFAGDIFGGSDLAQDCIERAYTQRLVIGNCDAVMPRGFCLQDDMATDLMNLGIAPSSAQYSRQLTAVKIAGQLQTKTSSRTRCRRRRDGDGRSK